MRFLQSAVLAVGALAGVAHAQSFSIARVEPLSGFSVQGSTFVLEAFGRAYELDLQPNSQLIGDLPAEQRAAIAGIELYRGSIVGVPDSWVRLTIAGDYLAGMMFDGIELLVIDDFVNVARWLPPGTLEPPVRTVIYRLDDVDGPVEDLLESPLPPMPGSSLLKNFGFNEFEKLAAINPGRSVTIGLVTDVEYFQSTGGSMLMLLNMMNYVDRILITRLGVQLKVAQIVNFEIEPDPFTTAQPSPLLDELELFKLSRPELASLGLVHLLTGKDLIDQPNSNLQTVGLANLGGVCHPRLGAALTQVPVPAGIRERVFLHEIGHNLGAPHDGEVGSACAAVAGTAFLMSPNAQGSLEFSDCSIAQMRSVVLAGACFSPLDPTDLTIQIIRMPPVVVDMNQPFTVLIRMSNPGSAAAVGPQLFTVAPNFSGPEVELELSILGGGECDLTADPRHCQWTHLGANDSVVTELTFVGRTPGLGNIDLSMTSLSELNPNNDVVRLQVNVVGPVDLRTSVSPGVLLLHPGEAATVRASIANVGTSLATQNSVGLKIGPAALQFVDLGLANCVPDGDQNASGHECPLPNISPGQSYEFDIRVAAPASLAAAVQRSLTVSVRSRETELTGADNSAGTAITAAATIADVGMTLAGPATVTLNQNFTYTATVRNLGPDTAQAVTVRHVPTGVAIIPALTSVSSNRGTCTIDVPASDFTCNIGDLAANEAAVITFAGSSASPGQRTLSARASSTSTDPDANNDQRSMNVTFSAAAAAAASGGGGGGGSLDLLSLLTLLLAGGAGLLRANASQATRARPLTCELPRPQDSATRGCHLNESFRR